MFFWSALKWKKIRTVFLTQSQKTKISREMFENHRTFFSNEQIAWESLQSPGSLAKSPFLATFCVKKRLATPRQVLFKATPGFQLSSCRVVTNCSEKQNYRNFSVMPLTNVRHSWRSSKMSSMACRSLLPSKVPKPQEKVFSRQIIVYWASRVFVDGWSESSSINFKLIFESDQY